MPLLTENTRNVQSGTAQADKGCPRQVGLHVLYAGASIGTETSTYCL